jgi:hypothetical protein
MGGWAGVGEPRGGVPRDWGSQGWGYPRWVAQGVGVQGWEAHRCRKGGGVSVLLEGEILDR